VALEFPADEPDFDRGTPGASVARQFKRRKLKREARTRAKHPHIGGLLLALTHAPQHETAWGRGELGEVAVGESLEARTAAGPAVLLHDRRIPGSRANIDHIAIAPTGVYVVDAKSQKGKVRVDKPWFGPPKLTIDGRDSTKLIDGLDRQVAAVITALPALTELLRPMPVTGVLCFTDANLPHLGTLTMRRHLLLYRKALAKRLNAAGPIDSDAIRQLAQHLAAALPAA
jgi:hypothetical protein